VALCLAFSSTAVFSSSAPRPAPALAGIIVNSTSEAAANDGLCTLREAITSANSDTASGAASGECAAGAGADTIIFTVPGTINLTSALPDITSNLAINGWAPDVHTVRRNAGGTYRLFTVTPGVTATISGLTITGGSEASGGGIHNSGTLTLNNCAVSGNRTLAGGSGSPGGDGGGIYNQGTLTLINTTVSGNATGDGGATGGINMTARGGHGGGIYNTGTLRVTSSTISNNTTGKAGASSSQGGNGGGISNGTVAATLNMTNSTVSGNATGDGGVGSAGGFGGGVINIGTATFTGCTIVNNRTGGGMAGGYGGGIASGGFPSSTTLGNTIVADNTVPLAGSGPDINSEINSQDYNLIESTFGTTINGTTTHNIYGQDPRLGPLASNGGPTQTHALLPDSPAIDKGKNFATDAGGNPIVTDQRLTSSRPRDLDDSLYPNASGGDGSDVGAFELFMMIVNSTADTNDGGCTPAGTGNGCTLREAMNAVNMSVSPASTIIFTPSLTAGGPATINLTGELLNLATAVNIIGPGAGQLTVRRETGGNYRIFTVSIGATVNISGLTVSNGRTPDGLGAFSDAGNGGGIFNAGTLSLADVAVIENRTGNGVFTENMGVWRGGDGGGIYNKGALYLSGVTVAGNQTGTSDQFGLGGTPPSGGAGGGIANFGTLSLTNSTVSGNQTGVGRAETGGGPVGVAGAGGGIANVGSMALVNSTVASNLAGTPPDSGQGGGISNDPLFYLPSGTATVGNTILAGNLPADAHGPVSSQGHNLFQNTLGTATISGNTATDIMGQDARLGPLADNGGPTRTHALLAGSPALDAGDNSLARDASNTALTTDQRGAGFARFADAADAGTTQTVDIGAFEAHPSVEEIANQATNEDTALSLNFNVGDAALGIASVTASSSNAALFPNDTSNVSVTGAGSTRTLTLTPLANLSGLATLTVTATGTNGRSMTDTFQVTVAAVNDAPTLAALGALTIDEDAGEQTVNLSGISAGAGEAQNLSVTAASSDTTLIPNPAVTYTSPSSTGSIGFAPAANRSGTATITVTVTDDGGTTGGGVNTFSRTFNVTVTAVNDAPVNTVPGAQATAQQTPLLFSAANSNAISVADVDAGTDAIKVTLTATNGTVTLGSMAGLSFVTGDGADDASVSFTGTAAAVNTALTGLSFKPAQGFSGAAGLQLVTDDQGRNGTGGALSDTDSVTINVAPGGVFLFGATAYEVNEDGSTATVTVSRTGGSAGAASVIFETSGGTATGGTACGAGVDYVSASATLSWADGEAAGKTVSVTICDDFALEGDETVGLSLSGVTGSATQTTTGASTLTIKDVEPAGGVFEFGQSAYNAAEGGTLTVTVRRTGTTSAAVSVDYATDDGSTPAVAVPCSATTGLALDRCDFTKALGTLHFAAGETEKTLKLLVGDDSYVEGPETLSLRLSNPTGGSALGATAAAAVTIADDSPESPGNPIDDTTKFVTQHYRDFLNRDPDAAGLAFWVQGIDSCGADAGCREVKRIDTSAAFFLSIEFQETGYFVYRMFKAAYGDANSPGVAGTVPVVRFNEFLTDTQRIGRDVIVNQGNWQAQLEANRQAYVLEFVQRPRFLAAFPLSMTAAEFVAQLEQNIGVTISAEERLQLVASLNVNPTNALNRASAVQQMANNTTMRQREFNRAFVLMEYFGYLRRNPDDAPEKDLNYAGWKFWLDKLEEFGGDYRRAEMVKAFITSIEYRRRFGPQ
jgi:CSLREA domain-containing protein